jgi:hypothetical protein
MIIFFNPTIAEEKTPSQYDFNTAAEYVLSQLKSDYNFNSIVRNDLNFKYFIEDQFPKWIIKESKTNVNVKIIELIQEFYNFYFSKNGLNLYPNYEYLQNIFFTNEESIKEYYNSLFADFDFEDFYDTKKTELREFLISNKSRFISNKGNKSSYDYFLKTLFPDNNYRFVLGVDETFVLNSSQLNDKTITDGVNYQEFSILLLSLINEKYQDDFISMLKPMGFNMNLIKDQELITSQLTSVSKVTPSKIAVTLS